MGLVTGLALLTAGVIFACDLRESLRLREIGFVATRAKHSGVWQLRYDRCRIFHVLLERAVTGFAVHDGMLASGLRLHDIVVAVGTSPVSGKGHRPSRDVLERIGPVVSIKSEALRNELGAHE
jgi:hypothetical protein